MEDAVESGIVAFMNERTNEGDVWLEPFSVVAFSPGRKCDQEESFPRGGVGFEKSAGIDFQVLNETPVLAAGRRWNPAAGMATPPWSKSLVEIHAAL
jgi:hypothetical protein